MATDPVRWTFDPRESWLSRLATYAPYGLFGGAGLLALSGGLAVIIFGTVDVTVLAVLVVLALVGGPLSLLYLWLLVNYGSNGSKWLEQHTRGRVTKRGVALSAVVGALLIVTAIAIAAELLAVFVAAVLVTVMVGSLLTTPVALEPRERRLTLGDDDRFGGATVVGLENVTGVWRVPLGPLSRWRLVVLRRVRGNPVVVPVPDRHVETVEQTLEAGLAATPTAEPKTAGTTRPMRIVLAAIGVGFFATAVGFAALASQAETAASGRAMVFTIYLGLFAAIALGYAGYESWLARRTTPSSDE
ncbi:hypothetical protein BDK88_2294 [Natrinema hispanicum]|uniref:PH domain-containing protein n=1 Tax=Natrinema hispanicum TaxID=392421 RepID=A0A482YGS5_9EURY|nr:hypothetical protein [Natrinema hispanicum]RZV11062.1 hypothetical protein BDK88_2294 [Natrinema hispanicum]